MRLNRRDLLALLPPALGALLVAACGGDDPPPSSSAGGASTPSGSEGGSAAASTATSAPAAASAQLTPTPACGDDDDEPTIAQTEGPYFTPNSPMRTSLVETGMSGTRLVLEGQVLTRSCSPVARAMVDFWQCDNAGVYDNSGYRLRGHQFTDDSGRFRLETIVPGLYTGRTRHIHVKVQAPNRPVLTTQLYFPNEPGNSRDGIYNEALLLEDYRDASGGKAGRFDFVLNIA
jgi:protocatechuate 3,4-dioxygenase beta subunit